MSIKVIELFAGVGGFRFGLERASKSFDFVWANQWEPNRKNQYAFNCYTYHFGNSLFHVNDDINNKEVQNQIPPHDLLVGGFPCQDYSVATTGAKGIEGKKGVLWWAIRDIVEKHQPKYILLENVDRLVKSPSSQRGRDFAIILRSLMDLGYIVEWRIVNAAEYGQAQRRRRIFIFAYNDKSSFYQKIYSHDPETVFDSSFLVKTFPIKSKKSSKTKDLSEYSDIKFLSDNCMFEFENSGIACNNVIHTFKVDAKEIENHPLGSILEHDVDTRYYVDNHEKWAYLKNSKKVPRVKPNGEQYFYSEGSIDFPDRHDKPSRTILTSESSLNRSTHIVSDIDTKRYRILTEVECERLNGFPDNWTNTGMPSKYRYFVMGNALVTGIITIIGENLLKLEK